MKNRLVVTALVAGLALTAAAAPVTAKKPSRKSGGELKLFLRWDDDGSGGCGPTYLSTEDAPDEGNSCAFVFQAAQEVLVAAGEDPLSHDWPGPLDKPVTFTAGKIAGEFEVKALAAAEGSLELELTALTTTGAVDIGEFKSETFNTAALRSVPIGFKLKVPKKLVGKKVESITLSTTFRGVAVQSYIELDDPPAFITFPVE